MGWIIRVINTHYYSDGFHAAFFPEVGGATLDSHHGFVVEYGMNRDVDLGALSIRP